MPPDRPTMAAVISAALRERRPGLPLPTAERDAAAVLRRLREAGWRVEREEHGPAK